MIIEPRPFQFSLRTIFIVTTALAVVCSGLFAGPIWATMLTVFVLVTLTPVAFTVALVYGRGYTRTFCIGALFPSGAVLVSSLSLYPYSLFSNFSSLLGTLDPETRLYVGIVSGAIITAILVSGLFAMGVRWVVERSQRPEPVASASESGLGDGGEEADGPPPAA